MLAESRQSRESLVIIGSVIILRRSDLADGSRPLPLPLPLPLPFPLPFPLSLPLPLPLLFFAGQVRQRRKRLLGAGDGGYFLFYVPTHNKINFIKAIKKKNLHIEPFTFDDIGLRSWITKDRL